MSAGWIPIGIFAFAALVVGVDHGWMWLVWPALLVLISFYLLLRLAARFGSHFDKGFDKASVKKHEAGHTNVARALKQRTKTELYYDKRTDNWSGAVYVLGGPRLEPWQVAAIARGGEVASGNDVGCGFDKKLVRDSLAKYPSFFSDERRRRDQQAWEFARKHA